MKISAAIRLGLCLGTLCVLCSTASSQTPVPVATLTSENAVQLRRISDLNWSPDGKSLIFAVSEKPTGPERQIHLWIYRTGAEKVTQFTYSTKSETDPRWSPDGKSLAFISDREEARQIYVIPASGGEAQRLTKGKQAIQRLVWSPDGKQIAFLAAVEKTEAEEKKEKDKDDAHVVDKEDKRAHLWLVDLDGGKARQLAGEPWEFKEIRWPQAGELIAIATDHPESDQDTDRIVAVTTSDGKVREVVKTRGPIGGLDASPDGKSISWVASRADGPQPDDLFVMALAGGEPHNLTAKADSTVEAYSWANDGTMRASLANGFRTKFFRVAPQGEAKALELQPEMDCPEVAASPSGELAYAAQKMNDPMELYIASGNAAPKRVSGFNDVLRSLPLIAPEFLRYKTFDGQQIEGALLKPAHYDGKSKVPTVLLIHGGPTGRWSDSFDSWGQLLAAAGYAVFYPNVRGSTGYGREFSIANRGDWGGNDFKDVMAAADYLVARGIADPNRLGIGGWSYGGYMSEWAITQTHRFKAAVSGAGMADLATEYGTEEHPSYDEWFYGLPYEKPEGFRKSSPINYVKNAKTPTLILQGEADTIDPLSQSQMLYRGLKRYGVPSELVVYPREGHGLREEKHLVDRLRRIVAWYDKYLK